MLGRTFFAAGKKSKEAIMMTKKEFEPAEMTVQLFVDVIVTSDYVGAQGEYDIFGNWVPLPKDEP